VVEEVEEVAQTAAGVDSRLEGYDDRRRAA